MSNVPRTLSITAVLVGASTVATAHAVPYTLPSNTALPFAQIQAEGGGPTVCATWLDGGACDVAAGRYRLLTYRPNWQGEPARFVTIGEPEDDAVEAAPVNLRVDVYSTRSLELFWDRPAPGVETRYEVRRDGEVIGIKDGTSFYQTNLEAGRTYRYEVARVTSSGDRSAVASITVMTDGGRVPPPTITTAGAERLIVAAFDVIAGEGYAEETLALGDLPRELGLDIPDTGATRSITPRTLVCDNGGTAVYGLQDLATSASRFERHEFDACQLDTTTFDGTLLRSISKASEEVVEVGGIDLVIDRQDRVFELDGTVSFVPVRGLTEPGRRFAFTGESLNYSLPDGTLELGSGSSGGGNDIVLTCGQLALRDSGGSGEDRFTEVEVQQASGSFSLRSPATDGKTLSVAQSGEFVRFVSGGPSVRSEAFITGALSIRAEDGSELVMDADNGDPSTYTVTVTTRDGSERSRFPFAPSMQRLSDSFVGRCRD